MPSTKTTWKRDSRSRKAIPALGLAAFSLVAACDPGESGPLPTFPVELRMGGQLPEGGLVGEYAVTFTEAWVVLGDLHLYGMDREAAGYAHVLPGLLKHAGHAHGDAEMETLVEGTWALDLLAEPAVLATNDLTEGHWFDGSLRLRPCTEIYAPVFAGTDTAVETSDPLWGHTLWLTGEASLDASTVFAFELVVDTEAMVSGIDYGGTVKEGGATTITTLLDLGALLTGIDFAALANGDGLVRLDPAAAGDAYLGLKVRLQDPVSYLHEEAEPPPTP